VGLKRFDHNLCKQTFPRHTFIIIRINNNRFENKKKDYEEVGADSLEDEDEEGEEY